MDVSIGFSNPVIRADSTSNKFRAVEAFDDYFFLSGKKARIIAPLQDTENNKDFLVKQEEVKANIPLNILKVVSYCTVIVPLIMLVGKAIARAKYNFVSEEKLKELKVLEDKSATKIQAAYKAYVARKEFLEKKKAAICIQSHFRAIQAKKEYENLKKKKVHVLKSLKEIVDTEKSFLDDMVKHVEVMQDPEFKTALKKKGDKEEFDTFIEQYLLLISKSKMMLEKLEGIVEVQDNPIAAKTKVISAPEIKDTKTPSEVRGPLTAQDPMGGIASDSIKTKPTKVSQASKANDMLAKKSAMKMKKEVAEMSEVVMSKEFEQYVDSLIAITKCADRFAEMVDEKQATKIAGQKGLLQFAPCLITFQRMTRYPMMLGQTKDILTKMELTKEIDLVTQAKEKASYPVKEFNIEQHTKEANSLIKKYHRIHADDGKLLNFGHKKQVAEIHEQIREYLDSKMVYETSPKDNSELTPAELANKKALENLVALEMEIIQKRADGLLKGKKTEESRLELSRISEKISKGLQWISDERVSRNLQSLNERIVAKL